MMNENLLFEIETLSQRIGYIDAIIHLAEEKNIDVEDFFELIAGENPLVEKIKQEFIDKKMVRDINFKVFDTYKKLF